MTRLVLVTGGAGFIGSHLVDALLARGDRVRVVDDFSSGRRENLAHCLDDVELFEGDVRDPGLVGHAVAGCDGVLHEAAIASVARSVSDPVGTGSVTHGGTVNVATQARRAGVGGFVLASSCAVYGDTDALPIDEDAPPRPQSPYALAKLLSEGVCRPDPPRASGGLLRPLEANRRAAGGREEGRPFRDRSMRALSLRYFNVFGPRQDPSSEYSGVVARFMRVAAVRAARRGRDVAVPPYVVYGDGRQSRDFVFVSDVVGANLLALDACLGVSGPRGHDAEAHAAGPEADLGAEHTPAGFVEGPVVNVGTGVRVEVLEIVTEVERLSAASVGAGVEAEGSWPSREREEKGAAAALVEFRAPREGDIRASQADITRAGRVLGYEPTVSFSEGLAATYRWYLAAGVS